MSQESFTTTISVDVAPHVAFAAITNPRGWWSTDIEGPTANLGDEFAYSHGDMHRCRLRVVASVPGEKVAWHVLAEW